MEIRPAFTPATWLEYFDQLGLVFEPIEEDVDGELLTHWIAVDEPRTIPFLYV